MARFYAAFSIGKHKTRSISELFRTSGSAAIAPSPSSTQIGKNSPTQGHSALRGPSEFEKVLQQESTLNLSQHAETRIRSREIPWSQDLEKRISSGIDQASSKGSRETLILAGDVAVIANVKSRTVVTAMDRSQLKERIFTNIDSAVLV